MHSSAGAAATATTTSALGGQLMSPQQVAKRKNNPPGTIKGRGGGIVQKQGHHSNHGGAKSSSHNKSTADDMALKGLLKSYPSSLEFHTMHGDFSLFSRTLYPMERQLLKFLLLKMVNKTQLAEVGSVLTKQAHRPLLHKVRINRPIVTFAPPTNFTHDYPPFDCPSYCLSTIFTLQALGCETAHSHTVREPSAAAGACVSASSG
jgi:hypothetical protein